MKKLHYFLGALLVGGATVSLSSCIDTTEPIGIEAMRSSKAEWIKAKAAYENALAQFKLVEVEKEKVAVEAAKVALELDKIEVEQAKLELAKQTVLDSLELVLAEAQTELDLAGIQYEFEELANQSARDALALALAMAQNEVDLAEVQLAMAELNKQMLALDQEIAEMELSREEYLLQREATLLGLYESIAEAEKSYLQAVTDVKIALLTYKDDKFAEKLQGYQDKLDAIKPLLKTERENLAKAQLDKWQFEASRSLYVEQLPVNKAKKEKEIALQKSYIAKLDSLDKLDVEDITALYAQQAEYEEEIESLVEKQKELKDEITEMSKIDLETADEIAELNKEVLEVAEGYKEEFTITIAKSDLTETMAARLYDLYKASKPGNFEEAFNDEKQMLEDFDLYVGELFNVVEDPDATTHSSAKKQYTGELNKLKGYQTTYRNQFNALGLTGNPEFDDETGDVLPSYAARVEAELSRRAKDDAKIKSDYEKVLSEWLKTYTAYKKAFDAFGAYTNNNTRYNKLVKEIEEYNDLDASDKTYDLAVSLRDEIIRFISLKNDVDGMLTSSAKAFMENTYYGFDEDGNDLFEDKSMNMNQFNAVVSGVNFAQYTLGGEVPANKYTSTSEIAAAAEVGGTLAKFLQKSNELLGTGIVSIAAAVIPVENQIPEGTTADPSSVYGLYLANTDATKTDVLKEVGKWAELYVKMKAGADQAQGVYDAIAAEIKVLNEQIEELKKLDNQYEIWAKEYECYAIFGSVASVEIKGNTTNVSYSMSAKNPYNIANVALVTEYDVIKDLKDIVDKAIVSGAGTYWFYNPVTNAMEQSTTLATMISAAEKTLETYEGDLKVIEQTIEKYEQFEELDDKGVLQFYEATIAKHEAAVADYESKMKEIEATISAIIAAYEGGELDVALPEAGE